MLACRHLDVFTVGDIPDSARTDGEVDAATHRQTYTSLNIPVPAHLLEDPLFSRSLADVRKGSLKGRSPGGELHASGRLALTGPEKRYVALAAQKQLANQPNFVQPAHDVNEGGLPDKPEVRCSTPRCRFCDFIYFSLSHTALGVREADLPGWPDGTLVNPTLECL